MGFRPKIKLMGEPSAPPGYNYEDTLENFLRLSLDKGEELVVVLDTSGGQEAPTDKEEHETTQAHHQD